LAQKGDEEREEEERPPGVESYEKGGERVGDLVEADES